MVSQVQYDKSRVLDFSEIIASLSVPLPKDSADPEFAMELYDKIQVIEQQRTRMLFHYGCILYFFPQMDVSELRSEMLRKKHLYSSVAFHFGFQETELMKFVKESGISNIEELYDHIFTTPKPSIGTPKYSDTDSIVQHLQKKWKEVYGKADLEEYFWNDIKVIRDYILDIIPVTDQLVDRNYLAYSRCSCCAEEPQQEAHLLIPFNYEDAIGILLPVCKKCYHRNEKPNFLYGLYLYRNYAHALERSLEIFHGMVR